MKSLFLDYYREKALTNIYKLCGMSDKLHIERWIVNSMQENKWYNVKLENIDKLKLLFKKMITDYKIELTFNKDYTKIKKTLWD